MPAGNVFKPRRSLTRQTNPIQRNAVAMSTDDTRGQGQVRLDRAPQLYANPMQLVGGPQSFNPQNQDVLSRAAAALRAVEQDRLNPMYGGQQGYAAPGQNAQIGGMTPNLVTQGIGVLDAIGQSGRRAYDAFMASDRQGMMYGGQQGYAAPGANGAGIGQAVPGRGAALPQYNPDSQAMSIRRSAQDIDAMRLRSQQDNPIGLPRDQSYDRMNRSDDMLQRNMDFIQTNPHPRTSLDAARMSQGAFDRGTSGLSNGYNGRFDNPMMSADEKLQFAEQNAQRIVGGGAAADPTNMRGRFGGAYGVGLEADAAAIRGGRAVRLADGSVSYFTGTQESARRAQLAGKTDREWLRNRDNKDVPQTELDRRAKTDAQQAARSAKAREFEAANNGMNYRQMDRLNRQNALTEKAVREGRLGADAGNLRMQNRADTALRRSGNPMLAGTDASRQLFPDMNKKKGAPAAQNPMQAGNPFGLGVGGTTTPDGALAGRNYLKTAVTGGKAPDGSDVPPNAFLAATGATGEEDNIQDLHFGIQQQVQEGKMPTGEDLKALHAATQAMQAGYGTPSYDPFDMTYGFEGLSTADQQHTEVFAPMYKELASMKNPTPRQLTDWWGKFSSRIRPARPHGIASGGMEQSLMGTEYPLPAPQVSSNPMR